MVSCKEEHAAILQCEINTLTANSGQCSLSEHIFSMLTSYHLQNYLEFTHTVVYQINHTIVQALKKQKYVSILDTHVIEIFVSLLSHGH